MSDKDLELLIRIAGNLEGISATLDDKPLANYLCDISEWIDCPFQAPDKFFECSGLVHSALALIKELTEENTKLANRLLEKDVIILEQGKFVEENERLKTELRQTAQKLKAAEEANEMLSESYDHLEKTKDELLADRSRLIEDSLRLIGERDTLYMLVKDLRGQNRLKRYYDENENIDRVVEELIKGAGAPDNKCVSRGETIPEGRQVCPGCEGGGRDGKNET